MPLPNLHITALEITHSKTAPEIQELAQSMQSIIPTIVSYTLTHRTRLIKPTLSYDASALALSFVPAAGESLPPGRKKEEDAFTYHHLRRDLFELCSQAGVNVDSRYVVPSSHLTVARFIDGGLGREGVERLVSKIEEVNAWLEEEYWPKGDARIKEGGEWIVGEERGLECRVGMLWYGGGERVMIGEGF